ncbi:formate dehydrogenase family accessory protein FdhD [Methanocaldococcus infernus ME]|uniref:Formate dehydrogenase family accessory protein FdhD n=1 Tax=Methanocaldococcus infernus (strain DSM 11812 / JCM 15783 / ME) TaxID=573063 RepID=D5VTN8_METIM|nr:formate dehydrogenase accessory sulfurtransferase FdhD [Methanocaldococcus infernus]ADG13941.1 formate dehydrogenase family accessory protein FdhD [Methanocaldococcus infernus ME]
MIKRVKVKIDGKEEYIYVPVEEFYNLHINDRLILSSHSISPSNLKEFSAGFSVSEGYLTNIEAIEIEEKNIYVYGSYEKKERKKGNLNLDINLIKKIGSLELDYKYWKLTSGFHWASIFEGEEIICFFEDISRHNAVDKAIGFCILNNKNFDNLILRYSGRIPYEIVRKAVNANINVIISKATATDKAIELAKREGIALIKVKDGKATVY